ncbi:MAG: HNH endonuclease family protein, partial [Luteibacter jiangsuensis]
SDLVRNEIFRKISDETPERIERIDEEVWQPFYASFEVGGANQFEKYLFPFGLVVDQNLRKSDVFINLRNQWNQFADPAEIVDSLDRFKAPFLDTLFGSNLSGFSKDLAKRYARLSALGAPSSILPFTMRLGREVLDHNVEETAAAEVLDVIESFLVRRAIVGHEPTGLHAVFKRLWSDLNGDVSRASVSRAIADHKTVAWPDDAEVREAIATRPLYGSAITPFLLLEHDNSLGGDAHDSIETIEHVLPQAADEEWKQSYGDKFAASELNALPNLIPCTGRMNSAIGNQSYAQKKVRFAKDSKFKSTREFSGTYVEWTHQQFLERAAALSAWAQERFPHQSPLQRAPNTEQGND